MNYNKKLLSVNLFAFAFVAVVLVSMSSCSSARYNMMNPYLDSTQVVKLNNYPFEYQEPVIKKYDIVKVQFAGMNPSTTALLNSYGGTQMENTLKATEGQPEQTGQQVDGDGNLNFPLIGKVKAEGLTKARLREELTKAVTPILKDPFVFVELPKRGVTILGEVKVPKSIVFPKERANIFETLAAVGYTTEFADLTRVKVYRESSDGTRQLAHLNLQDKAFFESPFFYPEPDDVIFVPSSDEKRLRNTGQTYAQFATIVLAVTSLIVSVVSLTN